MIRTLRTAVILTLAAAAPAAAATGLIDGFFARKEKRALEALPVLTRETLLAGAKKEGTFLWYAVPLPYNDAVIDAFSKAYPEIKVEKLYAGGAQLISRFSAESERAYDGADVVSSGLTEAFPGLRKKGWLADLRALPNWSKRPAWARDPNGAYYYYAAFKVGLMYNTTLVPESEAPVSFAELADPKWRGRVAVFDLTAGFTVPLFRYLLGPAGLDLNWVERLRANEPLLAANAGQLDEAVSSGRRALGMARDTEAAGAKKRGAPIAFKLAKEGFMVHLMPAAVNSRAPHPYAARLFVDWLLSEEAHQALAAQGVGVSQLTGAPELAASGGWALDAEAIEPAETKAFVKKLGAALRGR